MGNDSSSSYTVTCGGCSETVLYSGSSYSEYESMKNGSQKCGKCKQRDQDREDQLDRERRADELKRLEIDRNKQHQQELGQERKRREKELEKERKRREAQQEKRDKQFQQEMERQRKEQEQNRLDAAKRHQQQLKQNEQRMDAIKKSQEEDRALYKQQMKLQQDAQQKLQQQILNVMDDREKQQQQFKEREKTLQNQLNAQINQLKASNVKDQKEYEAKLRKLNDKNDKKFEKLSEARKKDKVAHEKKMAEITKQNEENMKKLQIDELKNRATQIIQVINTRLQQYKDKKEKVIEIFEQYKEQLLQIKLEERRLIKFSEENINPNLLNVVFLGITGHGKSTFACRLAGDKSDKCDSGIFEHSDAVTSVTQGIKKKICKNIWNVDLSIVDTPGIFDSGGKDREHANNLIEFLRGCGGVNAFLLVKTRIPPRFDSSFKDVLKTLEVLLGREFWEHIILIVTHTEGANALTFDKYAYTLKEHVYKEMNLKQNETQLKCIGVDSFENYKKPIKELIKIIPKHRFKCSELRSPLQELKLKNKNKKYQFDNIRDELDTIKKHIYLTNHQLQNANKLILKDDRNYQVQTADLSLIDNENKNEWEINIELPPEPKPKPIPQNKYNDDEKYYEQRRNSSQQQETKWSVFKKISYTFTGELGDDEITLQNLLDNDYKSPNWEKPVKLDTMNGKYQLFVDTFDTAKDKGEDVIITIIEHHYKNSNDENMIKIKRWVDNVVIDE